MAPGARTVELADGATIRVRPVEPTDAEALAEAFERLSPDSRYRRFMSATPRLSSGTLAYLVDVDHVDHEALVALDAETEEGVGVARYIRLAETPDAAEVAVTVARDVPVDPRALEGEELRVEGGELSHPPPLVFPRSPSADTGSD
jgi:hypothetical protein